MPLYVVRHGETERLIEASTASVAIRHAAKKIILAHPAKSKEVATLMGRGVQVEVAGVDPDPIPPVPLPDRKTVHVEVGPNDPAPDGTAAGSHDDPGTYEA